MDIFLSPWYDNLGNGHVVHLLIVKLILFLQQIQKWLYAVVYVACFIGKTKFKV